MPVVSTENVSVFIPLILRGKVSGSGDSSTLDYIQARIEARILFAKVIQSSDGGARSKITSHVIV